MSCEERSGFLFAHACSRLSVGACESCGKQVCRDHASTGEGAGTLCTSCAKRSVGTDRAAARSRYGDDPYWYAHGYYDDYHYYDDRDHRVFDPRAEPAGYEGDFEGS